MKAVYVSEPGGVENLVYGDVSLPTPKANEVLIQVKACAVNHLDLWVRKGLPHLKLPYPHVLGCDIAGTVVAVGSGVERQFAGEMPVLINPGISCGYCERCLKGEDNLCPEYKIIGEHLWGGYAEYVTVPVANLLPFPQGLSWEQAACIPLVFLTAWQMIVDRARVMPGEWVLVHAAGSGVGSAAIQIARLFGAHVIATASTDEKLALAESLGAEHVINYEKQDFLSEVKRITGKKGVDVVFEHTGQATWEKSILALTWGGRLVTCGATTGFEAKTDLRHVFFRQLQIMGSTMGRKGDLFRIIRLMEEGKLKPVLDRVMPLADAAQAHLRLQDRKQFGKIVLVA